ncbi:MULTISPECIES: helix-turn-helix domain-containing protein [Enterobacteriaceae]|mgnify:CR=1 FL=1|uniref:helix-turn-helix domain-containing protein n=1 Tax=Enterobacteriaceae TaxID=543 RepID=UPI00125D6460|nr:MULTISPECIES: helix-turn-helix transcriptional regulator [Enterobacteriaceae]EFC6552599.1 helix-turn-helix transcriptional regulator [Escherichia coli]EFL7416814.1 helix-turn-helix transcriptional regulator [Escherichia coli]EFN4126883.1 helix-turn-helix transcriptional regulator [Escherichia coli]EHH8710662.1 helix-turn-helix transcriptional regulator [Escherichia coli]EHN7806426.1 helix-turn-helix transcriptional regulator [Escherichia coli]
MNTIFPVKIPSHLRPILVGFRKTKGFTQREVSEKLGVSQQTYARLEANPSSASFERLFKVFTILGIEILLSAGLNRTGITSSVTIEKDTNSPARREKW